MLSKITAWNEARTKWWHGLEYVLRGICSDFAPWNFNSFFYIARAVLKIRNIHLRTLSLIETNKRTRDRNKQE